MTPQDRLKRLTNELRNNLCAADINARHQRLRAHNPKKNRLRRYRLVRTLPAVKIEIRMDGTRNHSCPHLHCKVGKKKHAATIAINNGSLLAGKLDSSQLREVQEWVEKHKKALRRLWDDMQAGKPTDELICQLKEEKE